MTLTERYFRVALNGVGAGVLRQRGDHTRFTVSDSYVRLSNRPVLGLRFEEQLGKPYSAALRTPAWFSNLLPEGPLRQWIADERGVSVDREMELLAQVGHDLPGAVTITQTPVELSAADAEEWTPPALAIRPCGSGNNTWRFSLAGVALKFSMLARGDRLTVPAVGERGDWLVKFPDYRFADVPRNEYTTMRLARAVGIDVPEVRLLERAELDGLPERMWPNQERWAYAVKRFDRSADTRGSVHIEDFAQVRDVYPQEKYLGTFETVAALSYRGRDLAALQEFARRLAFSVLVGNGDAHLKNWSLIYPDGRVPTLSPAYDLVSTFMYRDAADGPEDLGLKFDGTKRFDRVSLDSFARLERRLDGRFGTTHAGLADIAAETAKQAAATWPEHADTLRGHGIDPAPLAEWLRVRAADLLRARR